MSSNEDFQDQTLESIAIWQHLVDLGKELPSSRRYPPPPKPRRRVKFKTKGGTGERCTRTALRKTEYFSHQVLYNQNKDLLAQFVLDSKDARTCPFKPCVIVQTLRETWEKPNDKFVHLEHNVPSIDFNYFALASEISQAEIENGLAEMQNSSAPGPDGLDLSRLVKMNKDTDFLHRLFNSFLKSGTIPCQIKECHSRLIPQTIDAVGSQDITNWKPITFGSIIPRVFSAIFAERLRAACPIHWLQKGFMNISHCCENIGMLSNIMRHAKDNAEQLAMVKINCNKALNTISHLHIREALRARNIPEHIVHLILDVFTGATTSLGKIDGNHINLNAGLRQGDPLSPLLFKLALDHLFNKLECSGTPYKFIFHDDGTVVANLGVFNDENVTVERETDFSWSCSVKLCCLAFAEEIILISDSWLGMQNNLKIVSTFCVQTGLQLDVCKTRGFFLTPPNQNTNSLPVCPWILNGEEMSVLETHKYKQSFIPQLYPWIPLDKMDMEGTLQTWIERIKCAPLKPTQKMDVLKSHAIPRLMHVLKYQTTRKSTLCAMDDLIAKAVKSLLHLAPHTVDGFLYCREEDGGLGIIRLAKAVPEMIVKRDISLTLDSSPVCRVIALGSRSGLTLKRRIDKLGLKFTGTGIFQSRWRSDELINWRSQMVLDTGLCVFKNDPISNYWLKNLKFGQPNETILALKVRSNTIQTKATLSEGQAKKDQKCRHCSAKKETLSHIITQCPAIMRFRTTQHQRICDRLARLARASGWTCTKKTTIQDEKSNVRTPDLIFVKNKHAIVIDVIVPFEKDLPALLELYREKRRTYSSFVNTIKRTLNCNYVEVHGFLIGGRGKWFRKNNEILQQIGVRNARKEAEHFAHMTFLQTVQMLNHFGTN